MDKKDVRFAKVLVHNIFPKIFKGAPKIKIGNIECKPYSRRLMSFKRSHVCEICGLEASHFWAEANNNDASPHLNLYGEKDGREVVFTSQCKGSKIVCADCVPMFSSKMARRQKSKRQTKASKKFSQEKKFSDRRFYDIG